MRSDRLAEKLQRMASIEDYTANRRQLGMIRTYTAPTPDPWEAAEGLVVVGAGEEQRRTRIAVFQSKTEAAHRILKTSTIILDMLDVEFHKLYVMVLNSIIFFHRSENG